MDFLDNFFKKHQNYIIKISNTQKVETGALSLWY